MTTAQDALDALSLRPLSYEDEVSLHVAIHERLDEAGVSALHEYPLDRHNRIDFLCHHDGVGIEVKVAGSLETIVRQLTRYAHSPLIHELILVTTIARHRAVPVQIGNVPVHLHSLIGQGL